VGQPPQWLVWAREIQSLCQTGLAYASTEYDRSRYGRLLELSAEIICAHSSLERDPVVAAFLRQPGYATPKIDVRGAVIRDGKILLVREKADGCWCMPGGWADVGDVPSDMVAREVLEESGITAVARKVIGVYDANRLGDLEFFHAFKIVFLCDDRGGDPRGSDETLEAGFFDFDLLPPLSSPRTDLRHLEEIRRHLLDPARPAAFD
jgi:ADP-ribose pyrophosphatase YjhB (NUDIX family)